MRLIMLFKDFCTFQNKRSTKKSESTEASVETVDCRDHTAGADMEYAACTCLQECAYKTSITFQNKRSCGKSKKYGSEEADVPKRSAESTEKPSGDPVFASELRVTENVWDTHKMRVKVDDIGHCWSARCSNGARLASDQYGDTREEALSKLVDDVRTVQAFFAKAVELTERYMKNAGILQVEEKPKPTLSQMFAPPVRKFRHKLDEITRVVTGVEWEPNGELAAVLLTDIETGHGRWFSALEMDELLEAVEEE